MITLTAPMAQALAFYSEDHTHEAVAYPKTGTRVALIRRGLLTTGNHAWEHELTADGWAFLRSGQTMAQAHEMAIEINIDITRAVRAGRDSLDRNDRGPTDAELDEKITTRLAYLEAAVDAVNPAFSHKANAHALGMVRAHAFWLGVYRAERDRRSREATTYAYMDGLVAGSKAAGRPVPPAIELGQAVQDLMHGEALEQLRAERPAVHAEVLKAAFVSERAEHYRTRGYGDTEAVAYAKWDWLDSPRNPENRPVDALEELVADIHAAEAAGDVTPEGGVILRAIQ